VPAVDVGNGKVEDDERTWGEVGRQRGEEPPKVLLLGRLPRKAETDVHGLYLVALADLLRDEDGAVKTATAQDDQRATNGQGSPR
jgi:hypothetical protein